MLNRVPLLIMPALMGGNALANHVKFKISGARAVKPAFKMTGTM